MESTVSGFPQDPIRKKELFMIANVIVLLLVFGYCGLVLYWKHTGVLKDSCSSCGSSGCGGCGGCSGHCSSCKSAHAHHMDTHKQVKKHWSGMAVRIWRQWKIKSKNKIQKRSGEMGNSSGSMLYMVVLLIIIYVVGMGIYQGVKYIQKKREQARDKKFREEK